MKKTTEKCLECSKEADWIRHTQFSGSHPFCLEHAKLEKDFRKSDPSYFFWDKIKKKIKKKTSLKSGR